MTYKFLKQLLVIGFAIANLGLFAQIPNGYYNAAQGQTGYQLKTALHNIIKSGHSAQSYDELYDAYVIGDTDPEDGYVWDMYSENPNGADPYNFTHISDKCGNYSSEGDCYNREHVMPQSVFNEASPMVTDYFHIVPTDGKVNGMRSNHPFGEVSNPSWTSRNGSKLGTCSYPGYSGTVFEPIDEYKGDIARCLLYFGTRYQDRITSWSHPMLNGTADQVFTDWCLNLLLEWHQNDPVDNKEVVRNNAGYQFQGNRNPFIDHPEYVSAIWGGNSAPSISNIAINPTEPTAEQTVSVSATITAAGSITTAQLLWGTASTALSNTITMTTTGSNVYTTSQTIPAQVAGVTVYYQVRATDNNNLATNSGILSYTIGGTVDPQTEFFYDDFELANLDKWEPLNVTGTQAWSIDATHGVNSSHCAKMSGYASGNFANEDWLITKNINLTNTTEANVEFYSACNYTGADLVVKIATNYDAVNQPSDANWQTLNGITLSSGTWTWTNSGVISLNSYIGQNIRLAFVYTSTTTASKTWEIDQVKVFGKLVTDNTAPTVSFSPANNTSGVALNAPVVISFSEPVFDPAGNALTSAYLSSALSFTNAAQNAVNFNSSVNSTSTVVTVTPLSPLAYNTDYSVTVLANKFADAAGNLIASVNATNYRTLVESDTLPVVLQFYPSNAQTDIPVNTKITVSSAEPLFNAQGDSITAADLTDKLTIRETTSNGTLVSGTFSVLNNSRTIVFTPTENLKFLTVYHVALAQSVLHDSAANANSSISLSFTTANSVDETSPLFTSATLDSDFKTIRFTFSEPIIWKQNSNNVVSNFEVSINDAAFTQLTENNGANIAQNQIVLSLADALTQPSNVFKIKANSIADLSGNAFTSDIITPSFDGTISDTLPPVFSQGYPFMNQIEPNQAVLNIKLNEKGTVYYKVQPKTDAPPTIDAIKQNGQLLAEIAQTAYTAKLTSLLPASNYTVYFILQDFHTIPNQSKFISKTNFTTSNAPLPVITLQPEALSICAESVVQFAVQAESLTGLTYQWLCNNEEISGATNDTLTLMADTPMNGNLYRCRVSNTSGATLSNAAGLEVKPPVNAGDDIDISLKNDVESVDLFEYVTVIEGATADFTDLDHSNALIDHYFYPSQAGVGVFRIEFNLTGECNADASIITISVSDKASGVSENNESEVAIYPNPTNNLLNVNWKSAIAMEQIVILNISGQEVLNQKIDHKNAAQINTSNLLSGFYTIVLTSKNQRLIHPLVIVH